MATKTSRKRKLDPVKLQERSDYAIKDIGRIVSKNTNKVIGHRFTLGRPLNTTVDIRPPLQTAESGFGSWEYA